MRKKNKIDVTNLKRKHFYEKNIFLQVILNLSTQTIWNKSHAITLVNSGLKFTQYNCSEFYKYNYCKHILAEQIFDGALVDPTIKEIKKRGRKTNVSKSLEK